jgi:hypothetical protein
MIMSELPHIQEDFVVVRTGMERVDQVMTDETLMMRWMSPAVRFMPLEGWRFDRGARWQLSVAGIEANYIVFERRDGLILWAFDGFWEGFDAWHWRPHGDGETLIQNRIEYRVKLAGLDLIWPVTVGPVMGWDADVQMRRLQSVCEDI